MDKEVSGAGQLSGELTLPPDKSVSHRSAMFAAIADGESTIDNYSPAADPQSTLACLRQLGVPVDTDTGKENRIRIRGVGREGLKEPLSDLDCGNSGTTMRLLSGILTGAGVRSRLTGDASLSARTMKRILEPLRQMGGRITGRHDNYAPLDIQPDGVIQGIRYPLPIASAQLKSAILLAGLFGENPTEVIETGPSRDHTERLLQLPEEEYGNGKIIRSSLRSPIPIQNYRVPGDFSAASFWLVAGAIHPEAEILIRNMGLNPSRTAALQILQEMGADIEVRESEVSGPEPMGDVTVRSSGLRAVNLPPSLVPNCIDELPVLMVAMCFAEGRSEITGAEELRHKETDRLQAMANVLTASGGKFEVRKDGISIHGRGGSYRPDPAVFESEHDHRVAMASAVLALMADGRSTVRGAECTAISYPGFWSDLKSLTN
ncbi:MAG: 3-phosphoshikimate 1-carboxyvinyltransferase [Balneolaceae bacterium]